MKEATGELNMTVITVVAIAAVAAFFYAFVWPAIQTNLKLTTACNAAGSGDYTDTDNGITCKDGECTVDGSSAKKVCTSSSKKSGNTGGNGNG